MITTLWSFYTRLFRVLPTKTESYTFDFLWFPTHYYGHQSTDRSATISLYRADPARISQPDTKATTWLLFPTPDVFSDVGKPERHLSSCSSLTNQDYYPVELMKFQGTTLFLEGSLLSARPI